VTFFPKPKKVTKERFALRLALLARGGRWINCLRSLMKKVTALCRICTETQWLSKLSAELLQRRAGGLRIKHKLLGIESIFCLNGLKKQGLVFGATQHSCAHQPCS
jgi:hypothetical protein